MSLPSMLSGITPNIATFAETAEVIQYFPNWFNATDVKSLFAGQLTKDANRMPIKREERNVLQVFHKFGQWLRTWESTGEVGHSKQTFPR